MKTEKTKLLKNVRALILLVSAALVLSACATTGMYEKDAGIESSIRNASAYKAHLADNDITINSQNGKVTLTGTVPDASYKFLAEDVVMSIAGVKGVDNKLEPAGGSPAKGSDAWLGAKVKAELMSHPDLNVGKTDVYVQKGNVTLRGETVSPAQRDLAGIYAMKVEGVKDVVNEITVASAAGAQPRASAGQINDSVITVQVGTTLEANRSTSDLNAIITTNGGIVTVQGYADNQAQKDLVSRIISDIAGVKAVNNELMVQEPAALVR